MDDSESPSTNLNHYFTISKLQYYHTDLGTLSGDIDKIAFWVG